MGYDLLIIDTDQSLKPDEAEDLFCDAMDSTFGETEATDKICTFHRELIARFHTVDDSNLPWSHEFGGAINTLYIECVWPRADEVDFAVRSLAAAHSLVVFDPQTLQLHRPEEWNPQNWKPVTATEEWKGSTPLRRKRWWQFWLSK
ncbi:MAG: hypothetical protein GC164_14920 [Phycisphaera sp.]|nr:hypothetical protein [Phycisphaera sp.]